MKKQQKQILTASIGIAGLAAAAAGAYLLTGKRGEKNRKKISAWAIKAKKEIVSELKGVEKVSKKAYEETIKKVTDKYKQLKNVDPSELQSLITEAKGHWDAISQEIAAASKTVSKAATKVVKKAVSKKTTAPVAKKKVAKKK